MAGKHLVALCMAAAALLVSLGGGAGEAAPTAAEAPAQELRRGFSAAHDPSYSQFQSVLSDPTGAFALGFLRLNSTMLDLAVLHLPSSFPLWRAIPDSPAAWSAAASLSFDGGLVLTDRATNKVLWSTAATSVAAGDHAVLLNTSNLQIQSSSSGPPSVVWQSFDCPSETIVQDQNFTSAAALYTFDRRFAMRLGSSSFALYIEPPPLSSGGVAAAMYWKHTALEAKAQIVPGGGPTYARVDPDGYLGMYQKEGPPADVLSFDTFNHGIRALRRMTLEPDGNLRAYYWNGSRWVLDYTAITDSCELPTTCDAYSVCVPPGGRCACLANSTDGSGCAAASVGGGLCGTTGGEVGGLYWAVRRPGVEPANKELVGFEHAPSAEDCEARCARNCSCWGAVYSNGTGYCYLMDYPAQVMVAADERKVGYFKVRSREEEAPGGDELCGPDIWNKTWYPKAADHVTTEKTWYVVDATDKILGRLASTIAVHIRGKNEPTYTPSVDMGAFVVVVNAEKVAVSGKKRTQKLYRRHSGRPGGMKVETFDQLQKRIPERIVEHAVRGMLPKGRLGRRLFTHLKVYKGPEHPHEAQKPVPLPIRDKRVQKTD